MKVFPLFLITVLLASPAVAVEIVPGIGEPALGALSRSGPGTPMPQAERQSAKGTSPSREARLAQNLDLQASDLFTLDEPPGDAADLELKLPEESLPESDIPLTLNSKVEYFVNYFQNDEHGVFARWLSRSERYIPMMKQVLKKEGLPEDLVYLAMIESGFSPHAYSVASAVGPWQFMSGTGKRYALRIDQWIDERRDPLKSTVAAAMYLKELYGLFNKDWYLAAAGYNAGENKILRAIDMYNSRDFWQLSKGSYLKRETKDYVPRLLAAAIIAKEPARYGFADVAYLPSIEFDTVVIPSQTDLELVAKICDVPYQTIRELNPELRLWCTPPDYPNYELKIPLGKKALLEAEYAKIPEEKRFTDKVLYTRYKAKKRDTLAAVANRFGTTPQTIAELNHLKKEARLRGRTLTVPVPVASRDGSGRGETERAESEKPESKEFKKYYTVQKGDTLASLAKRFNVSAKLLALWNNLKEKVALRPGKRIIVARYVEKKGSMAPVENG
jgi:membrane-bound lytic murein transglycosylase D